MPKTKLNKSKKNIESCQKKLDEMTNNWKRALADYQNLEKRVAEDKINLSFISKKIVLVKLLPILDSLEKLKEDLKDKNLNIVIKTFYTALEDLNIKEVKALKEEFDPTTMEALELVEGPKNKVTKVCEKGYLLNGKLLRPSKVDVGLGQSEKEEKNV